MKRGRAEAILGQVVEAVKRWRDFAAEANIEADQIETIAKAHRVDLLDQ